MTNKQLLMFAVAGFLAPAASVSVANAEVHNSQVTVAVPAPTKDTAPTNTVQTTDGPVQRLKRTDQEQAGNEMTAFSLFGDGKNGLFFAMTTELNGAGATHRMQLSVTKFALTQDTATGTVSAVADTAHARFATDNDGNERRNANAPTAMTVNGGNVVCAKYNYQANGTSDTIRYIQCFNQAGDTILKQAKAFAKNNDDCSMHQDGEPGQVIDFDKTTATTKIIEWAGCNGNGDDDGWAFVTAVKCDSADAPTSCTFSNIFDVSLAQREERSRGNCTVGGADRTFAVCTWTEGNNQPQRDGVWIAGVRLDDPSAKGSKQQQTVLWKKQVAGRIDANDIRTYAQRAVQERVLQKDPATGQLVPTDTIIYRWGDASGNNNTNQGKGGTYRTQMLAVIKTAKDGITYVAQPVDMADKLRGLGGTHLGATAAMFGTDGNLQPGLVFLNGSHTGGGPGAQIRSVGLDPTTNTFSDLGMQQVASQDRHLYSNYLGNNPGNQGRNHSQMSVVPNPYAGQAGNTDSLLLISATSGKSMADVNNAAIKLTAFLTVTGIAQNKAAGTGGGTGTGGGDGTGGGNTGGSGAGSNDGSSDPGTTLGGCNSGGATTGLATFLLIGLAAFIRRRR
ncbi:MAG TPA: MYXO-CTERM sorting domain-containing protein [Kofleriaceae bacterium]|nr:MYXO-CTERM sorting domain-containing protein [Kofleriaceae bacterium]